MINSYYKVSLRALRAVGQDSDPGPQCTVHPFDMFDRDSVEAAWLEATDVCAGGVGRSISVWKASPLPGPWSYTAEIQAAHGLFRIEREAA